MHHRNLTWLSVLFAAGCHTSSSPPPTELLLADTNRDGVVDSNDSAGHDAWSATGGALFLANLDDDDKDGKADATDAVVNGDADALDLARIQLAPWPRASASSTGTVTIEGNNVTGVVNLFRLDAGVWSPVASGATLSKADLVAGLTFGIEATEFVPDAKTTSWDGYAIVHVVVQEGSKTVADDSVKLRVAPYVMANNLTPFVQLWTAPLGQDGTYDDPAQAFWNDFGTFAKAASIMLTDNGQGDYSNPDPDQWAEDYWQWGHTWIPAAGGTTQGMVVVQRSAQPERSAGAVAATMLGPDIGYIWPHTPGAEGVQTKEHGDSLDSFGDHDTIPPYTLGTDSYPLGRILIGGKTGDEIDPVVRAFYDAQAVQPVVQIDTTFLIVGHVDEIFTFAPANTPRGWKLLTASCTLARTVLQGLSTAGNGSTPMFVGEQWVDYDAQGNEMDVAADVTVDALLADPEIMAASDQAQAGIDAAVALMKTEVGLTDDEIVEIPILFERQPDGYGGYLTIAHMVGTANLRLMNGHAGVPTPHGPTINGVDALQTDLQTRLGSPMNALGADGMGIPITFVEDWADYHALEGEVHCGSTPVAGPMMTNLPWWSAGR